MCSSNAKISIIIPTLNESLHIGKLIDQIQKNCINRNYEVIIVDANSTDGTQELVKSKNVHLHVSNISCRAAQMNYGASFASGEILYFLHADVKPVVTFFDDIQDSINIGAEAGCFAYRFDRKDFLLTLNAYFTKYNILGMCGGGDQSLFIRKEIFNELNGYNLNYRIFEDYDLVKRIKQKYTFTVVKKRMVVSARKYEKNSWLKTQIAHSYIFFMYKIGTKNEKLFLKYHKLLKLK